MKIVKKVLLVLMIALFAGQVQAEALKRYEIKSGIVKYKIDGQAQGTEELYWINYGEKEARYTATSVKMFGIEQSNENITIVDGRWAYNIDSRTNTATKVDYSAMMEKMAGKTPTDFSEDMIKAFGGKKVGTEKVLGKKCDIYTMENMGNSKVWVYKGVALKMEASVMGFEHKMIATEFKENARVDQAKFKIPSNIKVVKEMTADDMPSAEQMQDAQQKIKDMQNNPEYQDAMKQMQDLQNSPEYQNALKQMQDLKNNPEYQDAMKKMQEMQGSSSQNAGSSVFEDAGTIVQEETKSALDENIRDKTKKGLKKMFGKIKIFD